MMKQVFEVDGFKDRLSAGMLYVILRNDLDRWGLESGGLSVVEVAAQQLAKADRAGPDKARMIVTVALSAVDRLKYPGFADVLEQIAAALGPAA
jgi:hypothetical protein